MFERENIPPELLRTINDCTLDVYNIMGEYGRRGTSQLAIQYMGAWLNGFSSAKNFPLVTTYVRGEEASLTPGFPVYDALVSGSVAVIRVMHYGDEHYVLATGISGDSVNLFDPYYGPHGLSASLWCNCTVPLRIMQSLGTKPYNMLSPEQRDALLFKKQGKVVER